MDKILNTQALITMLAIFKFTRQIKQLHVHHTVDPDKADFAKRPDGLYWQQSMRTYHIHTNGWDDIGQHLTLLPDGRWVTGRDWNLDPASIKGWNKGAFSIEIFGNF